MFIAIDQYGSTYKLDKFPRKELMDQLGVQHANKMYVDTKDGRTKHVGYVISGLWLSVFKLEDAFNN
jgi:hypothetical protein